MRQYNIPISFWGEETRDGYTISSNMKQIWAVQLDILQEIAMICNKHDIKYFAIGGTLLGAVRHKGYIPWDDDLDIAMYREDYNKFCKIAPKELHNPFFFQTEDTDPGYLLRHAKVRNSNTTAILSIQKDKKYKFNQGIFVDIFPLDRIPDDLEERDVYFEELFNTWGDVYKHSAFINRKDFIISGLESNYNREQIQNHVNNLYNRFEELSAKYNDVLTMEACIIALTVLPNKVNLNWTWKYEYFRELEYVPFEFLSIPIPKHSKEILSTTYGNWRKFVIGNNLHGEIVFDVNTPFLDYINS